MNTAPNQNNMENTPGRARSKKVLIRIALAVLVLVIGGIAYAAYRNPDLFQANMFFQRSSSRSIIQPIMDKPILKTVDNPCLGVLCPNGLTCQQGVCVDLSCLGNQCATGLSCQRGLCVDTACVDVTCPTGSSCQRGLCVTPAVCGNRKVETGEVCDDGNTVNETTCAYGQTCSSCNATCAQALTLVGPKCGDSIVNGSEVCDGSVPSGKTCATEKGQQYKKGSLSCVSCVVSTANCSK